MEPKWLHRYWKAEYLPGLSSEFLDAFREGALRVTSPLSQSIIFHLAGALNDHERRRRGGRQPRRPLHRRVRRHLATRRPRRPACGLGPGGVGADPALLDRRELRQLPAGRRRHRPDRRRLRHQLPAPPTGQGRPTTPTTCSASTATSPRRPDGQSTSANTTRGGKRSQLDSWRWPAEHRSSPGSNRHGQATRHEPYPTPHAHHRLDRRAVAPHQLCSVGHRNLSSPGRTPNLHLICSLEAERARTVGPRSRCGQVLATQAQPRASARPAPPCRRPSVPPPGHRPALQRRRRRPQPSGRALPAPTRQGSPRPSPAIRAGWPWRLHLACRKPP